MFIVYSGIGYISVYTPREISAKGYYILNYWGEAEMKLFYGRGGGRVNWNYVIGWGGQPAEIMLWGGGG